MTIHARQHGVAVPALHENANKPHDSLLSEFKSVGSIAYAQDRVAEYVWLAQWSLDRLLELLKEHHLYELGNAITADFATSHP